MKASDGFGMSECGPGMIRRFNDLPNHATKRITTPGTIIRICDPATSKIMEVGEPGQLHVGGPGVIETYW
jgi:acyl-coenzyme A synthetase/AMP-(fatty) acid ligase